MTRPIITVEDVVLPVLRSLHLNFYIEEKYAGSLFKVVTPALTCVEMGFWLKDAPSLVIADTSQVTHLRIYGPHVLYNYPALTVLQISLGSSRNVMSDIKTVVDSISLRAPLEVMEIKVGEKDRALDLDLIREIIDKGLGEKGVDARLLVSTEWEISMQPWTYKHASITKPHTFYTPIYPCAKNMPCHCLFPDLRL